MSTKENFTKGGISRKQLEHINSDACASLDNLLKVNMNLECTNKVIIKSDTVWNVPENVGYVKVTACAAGGDSSSNAVGKAGANVFEFPIYLRGKKSISITVGRGNTIFDEFLTLVANSFEGAILCNKLGYDTGYGDGKTHGFGGLLGFGGANGMSYDGIASDGLAEFGGKAVIRSDGGSATKGELIYKGAKGTVYDTGVNYGGSGSEYGSGAGGSAQRDTSQWGEQTGFGAGAGGFGASAGSTPSSSARFTQVAEGSSGIVIIEW